MVCLSDHCKYIPRPTSPCETNGDNYLLLHMIKLGGGGWNLFIKKASNWSTICFLKQLTRSWIFADVVKVLGRKESVQRGITRGRGTREIRRNIELQSVFNISWRTEHSAMGTRAVIKACFIYGWLLEAQLTYI